jgi:hypothetical protein
MLINSIPVISLEVVTVAEKRGNQLLKDPLENKQVLKIIKSTASTMQ